MTEISLPSFSVSPSSPVADAPPGPGVLLVHEGYGISAQLIRFAERLAAEGYRVVAPDFFFRAGGPEGADFMELIGSVTPEQLEGDLATGIGYLRDRGATTIGVTGFCMGGLFTYRAAKWAGALGVSAAAPFYGGGLAHELGDLGCPTRLFFGGRDDYIPMSDIELVQARHGDDVVLYPGAEHGFMRDGSPNYDEASANDAWKQLLGFFGEHLH
jgi:carboxymethylenebutenolidase